MVLVLDEDHTHYSDAFGNIFESGALSKKRFPEGSDGIKTKKGGPAQAISVSLLSARNVRMTITLIVIWQPYTSTFNGGVERAMDT